jgi:ribosomal protein L22
MSLAENIFKTLSADELKKAEKTLAQSKQTQAETLFTLFSKFEDADTIEIRFKKAFPKANIAVVKSQLGQLLLDEIYHQNVDNYAFAQVNELLLQIHVFIKKSAFDIVKKLLEKALKIAEENELFAQIADLLDVKTNPIERRRFRHA